MGSTFRLVLDRLWRALGLTLALGAFFSAGRALAQTNAPNTPSPEIVYANPLRLSFTSSSEEGVCGRPVDGSSNAVTCLPTEETRTRTLDRVTDLLVSDVASCALDGTEWKCWGGRLRWQHSLVETILATRPGDRIVKVGHQLCRVNEPSGTATCSNYGGVVGARRQRDGTVEFGPFPNLQKLAGSTQRMCVLAGGIAQCLSASFDAPFLTPTVPTPGAQHIAVTIRGVCIGADNGVHCYGREGEIASLAQPTWTGLRQLVANDWGMCAVRNDGRFECQAVDTTIAETFSQIPDHLIRVAELTMGAAFICAREEVGTVTCWGEPSLDRTAVPSGLQRVVRVESAADHSCALDDRGRVSCWGAPGSDSNTSPPLPTAGPVTKFLGANASCEWNQSGVRCLGEGIDPAPNLIGITAIAISPTTYPPGACAISRVSSTDPSTRVTCWGEGAESIGNVPADLSNPISVAVTQNTACAILGDGSVRCWGSDELGPLPRLNNVTKLLLAENRGCALDRFGMVCWGKEFDTNHLDVPEHLRDGRVLDFAMGRRHTCAVTTMNTVECWGENEHADSASPELNVPPLVNPISVTAFGQTTCATDDRGMTCWGLRTAFSPTSSAPYEIPSENRSLDYDPDGIN